MRTYKVWAYIEQCEEDEVGMIVDDETFDLGEPELVAEFDTEEEAREYVLRIDESGND